MTNEEFVKALHEKVSLLEVVLDHGILLQKIEQKRPWRAYCPFCEEQPIHFLSIRRIRKAAFFKLNHKLNSFHCSQCKVGGDVIEFIRNFHRVDQQEARYYLADKYKDRVKND
jgi:DNA primase